MDFTCKHLIYTSEISEKRRGYQFIAESSGVPQKDREAIEQYSVPSKVIPVDYDFEESLLLFSLPSGNYSFSKMVNNGLNFDGRPNNIYTHSLILSRKDLTYIKHNLLLLEKYFIMDSSLRGTLQSIRIESPPQRSPLTKENIAFLLSLVKNKHLLTGLFQSLLRNKTTVLLIGNELHTKNSAMAVRSVFPESYREKLTFATLDLDVSPKKEFSLVFIPKTIGCRNAGDQDIGIIDCTQETLKNINNITHYAKFLADSVINFKLSKIEEFNDLVARYNADMDNMDELLQYLKISEGITQISNVRDRAYTQYEMAKLMKNISVDHSMEHLDKALSLIQGQEDIGTLVGLFNEYLDLSIKSKNEEKATYKLYEVLSYLVDEDYLNELTYFIENINIPNTSFGNSVTESIIEEIEDFLNGSQEIEMTVLYELYIIQINLSKRRLESDHFYVRTYLERCRNGMKLIKTVPSYTKFLISYRWGLKYLEKGERKEHLKMVSTEFRNYQMYDECIECECELIEILIEAGGRTSLQTNELRQEFRNFIQLVSDLRYDVDTSVLNIFSKMAKMKMNEEIVDLATLLVEKQSFQLKEETWIELYDLFLDASDTFEINLDVGLWLIPSYMALLHRIDEQRDLDIITKRERKTIYNTIEKRVLTMTKELFEYYGDDLHTRHLDDYIINATDLAVNFYETIPKPISTNLIKLGRFYYFKDRARYKSRIFPFLRGIFHDSMDENKKVFEEINKILGKIKKKKKNIRQIFQRKRRD